MRRARGAGREQSPVRPVRAASAIFSLAVHLLPAGFRRAFGADIRRTFNDDAAEAYRRGGVVRLCRVTVSALADLAVDARSPLPGDSLMHAVSQDLRYAVRMMRRQPGFTVAAFAMLALGIGGNAAMFTLVNAALLRPLPYAAADRLVRVWGVRADLGEVRSNVNPNDAADWQKESPAIESLGTASTSAQPLTGAGDPVMVPVAFVSSGYLRTLQVSPALGRLFGTEHDSPGRETEIVITDGFWRGVLGGDANVLGRSVRLAELPCTIIGVLPPGFVSPGMRAGAEPQIWRPLVVAPDNRGGHFASAIARLRPGATIAEAQQQIGVVAERLSKEFPSTNFGQRARLEPLQEAIGGDARAPLLLLLGAVGIVLVIACANVASLLLARGTARRRELAVRGALGATRGRLVRQLLSESVTLAAAAAAGGIGVGYLVLAAVPAWLTDQMPTVMDTRMDVRVLAFTALLACITVILFGLAPAVVASRPDLRAALAAGTPGGGGGTGRQSTLVAVEAALAVLLLAGATLFLQSLARLHQVDPGFTTSHTLTFRVTLPRARYAEPPQRQAFYARLIERLSAQPDAVAAGGVNTSPLSGRSSCDSFALEDRAAPPAGQEPCAEVRVATPGYFAAMGIPLVGGRLLAESDVAAGQRVAVISDVMARRYWPAGNAVGQRFKWGSSEAKTPWLTVVGIIGNVRHFDLTEPPPDEVYMPLAQSSASAFTLAVRLTDDPAALRDRVRTLVGEIDPALPVAELRTTAEVVARSVALPAYRAQLLAGFAGLALVLALAGVYSLTAFQIAQRRREIGIRLALGATPREVKGMVARRSVRAVAIGCALGVAAAVPVMRVARTALYDVEPGDPASYLAAVLMLLATASVASYVPARRATRFDPVDTLRTD